MPLPIPVIQCAEHWKLDDVMWMFKPQPGSVDINKGMNTLVEWREASVMYLDIMKTIVAFKNGSFKMGTAIVTRALPYKRSLEEKVLW